MNNGKGSQPRPMTISREEFVRNWEEAFNKKDETKGLTKKPDEIESSKPRRRKKSL
jgi:hypothetical protein